MSCQLSVLSRFQDIAGVRNFLFPHLKDKSPAPAGKDDSQSESPDTDADWGDDWGWTADDEGSAAVPVAEIAESNTESVDDGIHKWLQSSVVSLSPNNDIIVIAKEDRICVLTQKWDPLNKGEEIDTRLTSVWQSSIKQEEGEQITAVICLPLASQKRSTQGAPDWTCVVVGFSSGYIRMYTESGVLLLSQLLHMEPVQKFKCRTYEPPRFIGLSEMHEELIVLYRKAVVCIDGFSLIQSLRACRNQVARAAASGGDSSYVPPPPLAYKKWALNDQEKINDLVSCGVTYPNPFDLLKNASMQGGFTATPKTNPPATSIYLTSGSGPYVGFFYAIEGSAQPILSEVAMAMANKLKSALLNAASGWLGFGGKQKEEAKEKAPKIEPATPLPLRFGLPDKRRSADSLLLSPCNNYIATTDSFGRVILVDVHRGIAVRMWKGYREAQVGWVQVREDDESQRQLPHSPSHSRVAQFLVIYAPRRGILEVWTAVNGPRVAAFNVSKHCVLVCPGYGLMGLNNVTYREIKSSWAFHCALLDPVDGAVKSLEIPFHLALSDKSSKRARDLHLLKKLKVTLKESNVETETLRNSVKELFLDIRIASISHQALERILSSRYLSVSFMQDIVQSCIARLSSKGEDNLDIDSRLLLRFAHMETGLLDTYAAVCRLTSQPSVSEQTYPASSDHEILQSALGLSEKEADNVAKQLERYNAVVRSGRSVVRVDVEPKSALPATSFLHCFSARSHASVSDEHGSGGKPAAGGTIFITKEVTEERRKALAHLLFEGCLSGRCCAEDVGMVLQESNLAPDQLMKLLLLYCLSQHHMDLSAALSLKVLVKTITAMTDMSEVLIDHNCVSAWWQRVREACSQSEQNCAALITALVCRKVAYDFVASLTDAKDPDADTASDKEEVDSDRDRGKSTAESCKDSLQPAVKGMVMKQSSSDYSSWENVSVDMAHWELLLKQLEDVLALSTLLHINIPTFEKDGADYKLDVKDPIRVSVSKLLDGGKGSVSELVACYVASQGLGARSLFRMPAEDDDLGLGHGREGQVQMMETDERVGNVTSMEQLQACLKDLRRQFPNSLDNDLLISNCCWEYCVLWNKDVEEVKNLQCSLDYLKLVQNGVLRQGVSSMMWHMFVAKRLSAAAQLMEKVGKAPKDRLCRKEVCISDRSLTAFCGCAVDLLNIIMEANCEANEVPVFNAEHNWQGVRGPASLGELAVDAKATNYGLVRLHWQLAILMHAVMQFRLKGVKILSLFERRGRAALFKDLHTHPFLPTKTVDESLAKERQIVLARIITSAIDALGEPLPDVRPHHKRPSMFTLYWPRTCMTLALELGVDEEYLRRHYVLELYNFGHDDLAHTIHGFITDQEKFGRQLLLVAGRRMAYHAIHENPKEMPRLIGEITPGLSYWLKSMDMEKLQYRKSPLSDNHKLLEEVTRRLPETSKEMELALELIEFTELLMTLKLSAEAQTENLASL